ncbi:MULTISPECIES: methylated-DNA--[protein]-cysteine S-methyltransferase [Kocuria]|uniref:Methylated-DNA--protein-cysteine methyltransferase n=1 Tax=Kocuria oceani TaxID=988827 RepID=A0ABV9TLX3_9MICC|nr:MULTISPECIES: methylated-DNA--[protein]-cysteine S-methyltransferase [Kocuria]KLU10810.1 cysteine methyltransferase [Kocuria sp. SM24M-10]OLT09106.1 cysteine methyltransferase [Kocuria sp. CNJ-770]
MGLRLSPASSASTTRRHALVESPIGPLALVEENGALAALSVEGARQGPVPDSFGARDDDVLPHVREQLDDYFAGRLQEFDADVVLHGTPFQVRVWNALAQVPYGTTGTYGQLARTIGAPRAAQAVGAANGRNPVSLLVPCHRIIGANGRLTGYAGGMARKEYLLRLEGALL